MTLLFAHKRYRATLRVPVRTAHGSWAEREGLALRLTTADGRHGYGEAAPISWFGCEALDAIETACRSIGKTVTPERLLAASAELPCLRFAVTGALAALAQREPGESVSSQEKKYLPVASLLPAGRAALELIKVRAESGFRSFKWKVGVGAAADEWALLDDLLAHLPIGGVLRLDANGAWDRRTAERWLERCAERPIEFVEQPVSPTARGADDLLHGLAADYPTPLALDESLISSADLEKWLGAGWPGFFILKPSLLAEVEPWLARLARAQAKVVFSSALETAIAAKRALQLALAYPGKGYALGFGVWPLFENPDLDGPRAAPFLTKADVERLDTEATWNALN